MDCVFCQIIAGKILAEILYQDDEVMAFPDINPLAPIHLLIIPKKHIFSLAQVPADEASLLGRMVGVANRLAREKGVAESGYRVVINSGRQGGQVVPHLHLHLLGGRQMVGGLG
ncbi:histidine triad nucleotide-binding protein [Chloroflexota bacterium]